jgi:tellurite methyltransferase
MKNILAGNIARFRKEKGLTQEELAKKLNLTYQAVSKWETGVSMPDIATLPKLAAELNVSVDKLLGYSAFKDEKLYYEKAYGNTDEYYWGVNPSQMCLKIISLMPPQRSSVQDKHIKILDIGCGEGKDAVFFARCGYDVSAFDISDAGIEKTKRLADIAKVNINVFKANINDYRLDSKYDILFSSGVFHCIKQELRDEIFANYKKHTTANGLNAFNVFVEKPFIPPPPEREKSGIFWRAGELLTFYHDWLTEDFSECIFECNSSGKPHQHAMNTLYARKKWGII